MASVQLLCPSLTLSFNPKQETLSSSQHCLKPKLTKRTVTISLLSSFLLSSGTLLTSQNAKAFDFGIVAPDQTLEQAQDGIKDHTKSLLGIKELLESDSWREAQKALRKNAGYLKQDLSTIIENMPGRDRPLYRQIYYELFSNVTRLDYAARDRDEVSVWEYYNKIVEVLSYLNDRLCSTNLVCF